MKIGYACINTRLRQLKPHVYVNRSMIKKTFNDRGISYASSLALKNLKDLFVILQWNHKHDIKFYRMSSNMFPWMSEYSFYDLPDFNTISTLLKQIGNFVISNGHRITFHPGPFNVLASPKQLVVKHTIDELNKHAQIMDLMQLPATTFHKINIHIGGAYNNKQDALNRWCDNFNLLKLSTKARITIENDDKINCYSVKDLVYVHDKLGIPIVIDYHHHTFNNGISLHDAVKIASCTWNGITPVIHYSESRNENKRAHSDFVLGPINTFGYDVDIMIEAKMKEQALLAYKYGKETTI